MAPLTAIPNFLCLHLGRWEPQHPKPPQVRKYGKRRLVLLHWVLLVWCVMCVFTPALRSLFSFEQCLHSGRCQLSPFPHLVREACMLQQGPFCAIMFCSQASDRRTFLSPSRWSGPAALSDFLSTPVCPEEYVVELYTEACVGTVDSTHINVGVLAQTCPPPHLYVPSPR
jgi:hypothetical protein